MILEDEVWQMFFDEASKIGLKGKIFAGGGWYLSCDKIISFLRNFH